MNAGIPPFLVWLAALSSAAVILILAATTLVLRMPAAWKNLFWRLAVITPLIVAPILLSDFRLRIPVSQPLEKKEVVPGLVPAAVPVAATQEKETFIQTPPVLKVSASSVILSVWLSGALTVAGLFILQHRKLRRQFRFSRKAELDASEWQAMSLAMVDIVTHPAARVPFCYGVFRPLIVLPAHFPKLSRNERWICLVHELTHLRRGDLGWLALAQLSCAIVWFNPLMWFAFGRLKDTAELATDDAILNEKATPVFYANTLVAVSELAGSGKTPAGVWAMARAGSLKSRLAAILDPATQRGTPGRPMSVVMFLIYLAVVGLASSVRTVSAAQQSLPLSNSQPPSNPNRDVMVDQLANFLDVSIWKTRVTLPMGTFSADIFQIVDGKIAQPVISYNPPFADRSEEAPETPISIMSAPVDGGTKVRLNFEWVAVSGRGSNSVSQIIPQRGAAKYGTFLCGLPETIGAGDYPLGGQAPSDKSDRLHLIESYADGLVLRIRKTNGGVAVYVKKDGSVVLNGKAITLGELKTLLGQLVATDASQEVAILSEKGADERVAGAIQEVCKSVGISRVISTSAPSE